MNLEWDELLSVNGPSIFLVSARERDIDIFSQRTPKNKNVIRLIRGKNCQTKDGLLNEFSSALQFPYYFGKNWDAFDECITDLSWLKNNNFILFITNANLLLKCGDPKELETFLEILKTAANFWQKKGTFKVVFQEEKEVNPQLEATSEKRTLTPFDKIK